MITKINRRLLIGLLFIICHLSFSMIFTSCSKDDGGGQPVINSVRSTYNRDSTFTEGLPGQQIVIQGQNLGGPKHIYVNGQEVGFNLNYCTSTHIIFNLPSEVEFYGEHATFKNEIVVETDHGTANYTFDVLAPVPTINRYEAEWHTVGDEVKLIPGQQVEVFGDNFYRVSRVYLCDADPYDEEAQPTKQIDMQSFEVNNAYNHLSIVLPQEIITGWLVVECKSGKAGYAFSANLPAPEIVDLSSEMPIEGCQVTITGRNFLEVQYINVNNEYRIESADLTVSPYQDFITFNLPRASAKDGFLEVVTLGGSSKTDFYPSTNVFLNFDDKNFTSYWWGESNVTSDDAKMGPKTSAGKYAGVEGTVGSQWWWGVIYCVGGLEYPKNIDASTPLNQLELRFECYVGYDLMGTKYKATFNDLEIPEAFELVDRTTGKTEIGQWMTVSVPLTKWMTGSFADFTAHWNGNFNINTNPSAEVVSQTLANYFDNFRIVKTK